ncbi:DUF1127 domain-containing protein [Ruegeria arenilitoris]|uniref:DUF1127 domain-containing protein n=1 Tax=Ruegeria arenilitoris TaxID=1173585 RepID=UPI00147C05A3|nr:DUF1127 domain-containing protein [Ruegeria arenilitoris]
MLDTMQPTQQPCPSASALLLFDRAMRIRAVKDDIVRAAQHLSGLDDRQLSELGINRCDLEETIERYI